MLSMNKRIASLGGKSLLLTYEAGDERATVIMNENGSRIETRFETTQLDRLVEQYMYIRQYSNGRRVR